MSIQSSNFGSLNKNTLDLQFREYGNIDDVLKYQKSRIIQSSDIEQQQGSGSNNALILSCPISHECDSLNNRIIIPNAQTILQETIQTDTANLLGSLEAGNIPQKSGLQKNQSEFLEQKLNSMKQKHKQLQQQLSEVSKIDSVSNKKKNVVHSQSTQGFFKGGVSTSNLDMFNFGSLKNQIKQMDVISNILSSIQLKPNNNQQKDIEVIIEKNDLYRILKILIDQLVSYIEKLNQVVSERDIIDIQRQNAEKLNNELKETIRILEEELKIYKNQSTETKIELEKQKALYDILEKKYLDLLKRKQEVKIINKETVKEIVIEKPIEILKEINNVRIVKQKKEVRKIIRPQAEVKHTIEKKLHILEREKIVPQIQVIEKVKEIPKIEFVDKEKVIEKPFFVEKLVDRFVEVPRFIPKEVLVDRPVYVDRPVNQFINNNRIQQKIKQKRLKKQLKCLKQQKKKNQSRDQYLLKNQLTDLQKRKLLLIDQSIFKNLQYIQKKLQKFLRLQKSKKQLIDLFTSINHVQKELLKNLYSQINMSQQILSQLIHILLQLFQHNLTHLLLIIRDLYLSKLVDKITFCHLLILYSKHFLKIQLHLHTLNSMFEKYLFVIVKQYSLIKISLFLKFQISLYLIISQSFTFQKINLFCKIKNYQKCIFVFQQTILQPLINLLLSDKFIQQKQFMILFIVSKQKIDILIFYNQYVNFLF
ncbi:alveolin 2 (macronuclear) [Tetrahymena thermophila SB210]|uniref:Alveolin 2 n=1 Tax=Tetrahymena thermophila (strain SB210) TaxID=312017 RepID=Q236J3_TETTS|nr:alveolin 2 [Tetrahymena thermophila SB210]EAR92507.2 alveolin 2 [Tetrahymena thermophila SB210]|eukprot:XP_001012752.2 alveolin 2 [Tetrahymena thermophila SB210]